jgi:hypothetical protein
MQKLDTVVAVYTALREAGFDMKSRSIVGNAYKTAEHERLRAEDDDSEQAGSLFRWVAPDAQTQLIGGLAEVAQDDIIERSLVHFGCDDGELGARRPLR